MREMPSLNARAQELPTELQEYLRSAYRRQAVVAALKGIEAGSIIAAMFAVIIHLSGRAFTFALIIGLLIVVACATVFFTRAPRALGHLALHVERRTNAFQNLLVTAIEQFGESVGEHVARTEGIPSRANVGTSDTVRSLISAQATSRIARAPVTQLYPLRRPLLRALTAVGAWALILAWLGPLGDNARSELRVAQALSSDAPLSIAEVQADVTLPAYVGGTRSRLENPDRIMALEGSRLSLNVRSNATMVSMIVDNDTTALVKQGDAFVAQRPIDHDGFIMLLATRSGDTLPARKLIGVSATPDAAPRVRITAPGRDMFLPEANRQLAISVESSDDFGLSRLRVRYTKVSGSGERFTFTEGELPLEVTRANGLEWKATARLALNTLGLSAGDMVVYRAVALDNRPGAQPVESDAFIAEIMAPGAIAADGFSVDPEQDRYAVSQQMLIVKTERLIASRPTMAPDSVLEASRDLAVEQRRVRAEFVFMMGGEFAADVAAEASMGDLDESHEAESESDLSAGRMVNQGRAALLAAIRAMSRSGTALTTAELTTALTHQRTAVKELEKAFSRTRYILRALSQRESLDPTRRLSGNLADASSNTSPVVHALPSEAVRRLREITLRLTSLSNDSAAAQRASQLQAMAAVILGVDVSLRPLQQASAQLSRASTAIAARRNQDAQHLIDSATVTIANVLQRDTNGAPVQGTTANLRRTEGALLDAMRRGGLR